MMLRSTLVVLLLPCVYVAHAQNQPSAFAGCYEISALSWNPPDKTVGLIPKRFQLLNEPIVPGDPVYKMRSLPLSGDKFENLWAWQPQERRVRVS